MSKKNQGFTWGAGPTRIKKKSLKDLPFPSCKYSEDSVFYDSWWEGAKAQRGVAEGYIKNLMEEE